MKNVNQVLLVLCIILAVTVVYLLYKLSIYTSVPTAMQNDMSMSAPTKIEVANGMTTYTNNRAKYMFTYPESYRTIEHLDDSPEDRDPRMPFYDDVIICPPGAETTVYKTGKGEACDISIEILSGTPTIEGGGGCDPADHSEVEVNGEMQDACVFEDSINQVYVSHPQGKSVIEVDAYWGGNMSKEDVLEILRSITFY